MKHLIPLLAFSFLVGCDGEKSNVAPSKDSPEKAASEAASETNQQRQYPLRNPSLQHHQLRQARSSLLQPRS